MLRRLLRLAGSADDDGKEPVRKRGRHTELARSTPAVVVARANNHLDIFGELAMPRELPHSRLSSVHIRYSTGSQLSLADGKWMLDSVKENLKAMYEESEMKWNDAEKEAELSHVDQRFLIVFLPDSEERVGFLSYRWDVEENQAVMYVYEVSVMKKFRGQHIAHALMLYAEDLCQKHGVKCIMLTVFLNNRAAMSLYRDKLNYVVDASSPSKFGYDDVGYEILSKDLTNRS